MRRILLLIITNILCACILPPLNKPSLLINPSNQFEPATYVFTFQLEKQINQSAVLEIEFPDQYTAEQLRNANCTFSNRICALAYPLGISTAEHTVSIVNVVNPASGGLSNFQIRTKIHASTIEQSKTFTNAGIRGSVEQFTYLQLTTSNLIAGLNSTYNVRFKVPKTFRMDVTFQLDLMTYYNQSNIVQNFTNLDSSAEYTITVPLRNPFNIDSLQDLPARIYKGTYLLVRGLATNPQFQPAPLQCTMSPIQPYVNSRYKVMDYLINISTLYAPIQDSTLQIVIPEYFGRFNSINGSLFYQSYGNNSLSYIGDRLYILNIVDNSTNIVYRLRLRNPNTIGKTSPFRHSILYQGNRYMFDETNCITTIVDMTQEPSHPTLIQSSNSLVDQLTNLTLPISSPARVCIDSVCQTSTGLIVGYQNPPWNGTYLVDITIGNVSYTDLLVVTPPTSEANITILGDITNISYMSLGITHGSIYIDGTGSGNFNCTLNGITKQCYYSGRIIIPGVSTQGTTNITIQGIVVTGTNTITVRQTDNSAMASVSSDTVQITYTTVQCPTVHVAYGSQNNITSCLSQSGMAKIVGDVRGVFVNQQAAQMLVEISQPVELILTVSVDTQSQTIWIYSDGVVYRHDVVVDRVATLNASLSMSSNVSNDIGVVYTLTVDTNLEGLLVISLPTYDLTNVFTDVMSVETSRITGNVTQTVNIYGMTNPSSSTHITVELLSASQSTLYANVSLPVVVSGHWTMANITSAIQFYPQNALQLSDYTIQLTVDRLVPAKSTLLVQFPPEYASLASPVCQLAGQYSCTVVSNLTVSIVLHSLDTIYLLNISNPFEGPTSPLQFSILYAGSLIAQGRSDSLLILPKSIEYILVDWSHYPTTVSESATFQFNILVNMSYSQLLFIRFPYQYDRQLGKAVSCLYMQMPVECSVSNWEVSIYLGQVNSAIRISILGIPNINQLADYVKIGVKDQNSYSQVYTAIRRIQSTEAGYPLTFNSLSNQIGYIRMLDNYNLSVYTELPITVSTMTMYLVLPSRVYKLPLGKISCQCLQFDVQCTAEHNSRIRIQPIGIQTISSGTIQLTLLAVSSPIDVSTVSQFYLQIVDELNQVVVARTYYNLEYYSLPYRQNGPIIMVNQEQDIHMYEGTSISLQVSISQPAIVQLTLRAIGPFSISPYSLILAVGTTSSTIRISSRKGQVGAYSIRWVIIGDMTPLYYTPIKSTTVHVIAQPVLVSVTAMNNVIQFSVPYSPDTNIIVTAYNTDTSSSVEFRQTDTVKYLQSNKSVYLRLSGINQPNFILSTSYVSIQIQPVNHQFTFSVHNTTKTTATLYLAIQAVVMMQHALDDTIASPTNTTTYFCNGQLYIIVQNLTSNTSYQSSLYLHDGTFLQTISYQTAVFDPVAQITFKFTQEVTPLLSKSFIQSLAYTLSVPLKLLAISQLTNDSMGIVVGQNQQQEQAPYAMTLLQNIHIRPERLRARVKSLVVEQEYQTAMGPIFPVPSVQSIVLSSYNIDMLSFVVSINSTGIIYGVLDTEVVEQPTTQQIFLGFTRHNVQPAAKRFILADLHNNVTFRFLEANKLYRFCLIVSNRDPNPTVHPYVSCIEAETRYPPEHARLIVKSSSRLVLLLLCLIFIL